MFSNSSQELITAITEGSRALALDVGDKTIGLALGDTTHTVATAFDTIKRTKFTKDLELLQSIINEQGVGGLVIGLPISMDGTEGPRCQSTRQFARNVLKEMEIPILLWDERLSTVAAERTLLEADMSRQKRKGVIDQLAAQHILQGVFDNIKNSN